MMYKLTLLFSLFAALASAQIRVGIVGTDTSHVPAFTSILNDPSHKDHVPGAKVVAAYKGGSKDLPSSWDRVDKYAEEINAKWGVEIVPDIATLLTKVDAILLESVDGRIHLSQFREIVKGGKPVFIDKPLAGTWETPRRSPAWRGSTMSSGSPVPRSAMARTSNRCAAPTPPASSPGARARLRRAITST
jgi:hypothetical protein